MDWDNFEAQYRVALDSAVSGVSGRDSLPASLECRRQFVIYLLQAGQSAPRELEALRFVAPSPSALSLMAGPTEKYRVEPPLGRSALHLNAS